MSDAARHSFGTVVVIGGGCYGSQYVRQLRRARAAGRATWERVVVVDRDPACAWVRSREADPHGASDLSGNPDGWHGIEGATSDWAVWLATWLAEAVAEPAAHTRDSIVPSPLMPHLLYEWLRGEGERIARRNLKAVTPDEFAGVPWQRPGNDGTRYVSYATWTCPINCIEPATCPHTKGDRSWSLHSALTANAAERVALLRVTHRTFGVGMIDVADVVAAHAIVSAAIRTGVRVRIATASHCHGAVADLAAP